MEVTIDIKHVNGMSKPKVTIDDGTVEYVLPFEVQLPPGTFDRIVNLFRQRIPVQLTISSPQAKMDLFTEVLSDTPGASFTEEEILELRDQARNALRTSESAEATANESGDAGDREVADAAAATAAEAVTKAADAISAVQTIKVDESMLLSALAEEVRAEIVAEGEMQALTDSDHPIIVDDNMSAEELQRQIAEHASESEAAAENGEKPKKTRKTKQPA